MDEARRVQGLAASASELPARHGSQLVVHLGEQRVGRLLVSPAGVGEGAGEDLAGSHAQEAGSQAKEFRISSSCVIYSYLLRRGFGE